MDWYVSFKKSMNPWYLICHLSFLVIGRHEIVTDNAS